MTRYSPVSDITLARTYLTIRGSQKEYWLTAKDITEEFALRYSPRARVTIQSALNELVSMGCVKYRILPDQYKTFVYDISYHENCDYCK